MSSDLIEASGSSRSALLCAAGQLSNILDQIVMWTPEYSLENGERCLLQKLVKDSTDPGSHIMLDLSERVFSIYEDQADLNEEAFSKTVHNFVSEFKRDATESGATVDPNEADEAIFEKILVGCCAIAEGWMKIAIETSSRKRPPR
jgi:hypothetical protein